ncbi:MAG TPA: hypothetical protein VMU37_04575 [Caulobacteraceae bacterium]|nr:hypothetical protein [Caulobacteraceae bacterium]
METGVFAIIAAAVAYLAGWKQARETRRAAQEQVEATREAARQQVEAADRQVAAANAQLAYAKENEERRRSSATESLKMGLSTDAARLKMEVGVILRHGISAGTSTPSERNAIAQANLLRLTVDVSRTPDLDTLLDKETVAAAREMAARVHQYNAVVLGGVVTGFGGEEWRQPLTMLDAACTALQKAIA